MRMLKRSSISQRRKQRSDTMVMVKADGEVIGTCTIYKKSDRLKIKNLTVDATILNKVEDITYLEIGFKPKKKPKKKDKE